MLLCFVVLVTLITLSSGVLLIYEPDGALLELSPVLPPNALFNNYLVPGLLLTIIGIANFMGLILIRTVFVLFMNGQQCIRYLSAK